MVITTLGCDWSSRPWSSRPRATTLVITTLVITTSGHDLGHHDLGYHDLGPLLVITTSGHSWSSRPWLSRPWAVIGHHDLGPLWGWFRGPPPSGSPHATKQPTRPANKTLEAVFLDGALAQLSLSFLFFLRASCGMWASLDLGSLVDRQI